MTPPLGKIPLVKKLVAAPGATPPGDGLAQASEAPRDAVPPQSPTPLPGGSGGGTPPPPKNKPGGLGSFMPERSERLTAAQARIAALGKRPEEYEIQEPGQRKRSAFFWGAIVTAASLIVWMNVGTLDIVSMTMGEVIPSTQIKRIQHLEGGIVLAILVHEGDKVIKGQPLVELEQTTSGADVGELKVRLNALAIDITRLKAEASGAQAPAFDSAMRTQHANLVREAMARFVNRRRTQQSKIKAQEQTVRQRVNDAKEISARIVRQRKALTLQNEQIAISEELLKEQLTNRYLHLDLLKTANELKGRIQEDSAALAKAVAAEQEAKNQLEAIKSGFLEDVHKDLDAAQLEYRELQQRVKKFEDSLRRTTLRSPVDGVIKTLYVTTVGGVIKPGDPVVDIVPGEDRLVIESKLPTRDIGYVQVGQTAVLSLPSRDARRFGRLDGKVVSISPDTQVSQDGVPYYKVRIETAKSYFGKGKMRYNLYPGMQVSANIETGRRTVFQYMFDPLLSNMGDAMQER